MTKKLITEETAGIIAEHHFGKKPKNISKLGNGMSNFVYEVVMSDAQYIIRICDIPAKINYYLKEQWAVNQAQQKGVPTPEILEVGNEIVPFPYMILKKIDGKDATTAHDKIKIAHEMGKYAALINSIPTHGFGHVFDWSSNTLSKNESFKEYLFKELNVPLRLKILEDNKMLSKGNLTKLKKEIKVLESLNGKPHLNHSDIRFKNVMIDDKEKIIALLDWENSNSNIAPHWELSIALHDLTIDEIQAFLEGYGMKEKEYRKIASSIKALNIINYAPFIAEAAEQKNKKALEAFKLRLGGDLDFYSL